jgi:predicted DNA-binding protein
MATELELLAKKYSKKKVLILREDIQKNLNRINQAALPFMRKLSAQAKKSKSNEIVLVAIIKGVE